MHTTALRLHPQQDLKAELEAFVQTQGIEAACIITCVGSLTQAAVRFAGQADGTLLEGKFEIVSLAGVMSRHGSHYHMAIADSTGRTLGGHVMPGCLIYTTAEIIIGILPHLSFWREPDPITTYQELAIGFIDPKDLIDPKE
ncbi:MAG: DNA-binding protein [Drouetiella hepatica Uher 2000/2452]|uniref:DNA-binding protein n=1 Tax=Drouetiella hepatica Uher 2000/2452 TaxID=904376 RepID=A0A951ULQ0_9CYAN|nr:DNA-binding protein [Drouetiella hepatica Uher 2000/2452]